MFEVNGVIDDLGNDLIRHFDVSLMSPRWWQQLLCWATRVRPQHLHCQWAVHQTSDCRSRDVFALVMLFDLFWWYWSNYQRCSTHVTLKWVGVELRRLTARQIYTNLFADRIQGSRKDELGLDAQSRGLRLWFVRQPCLAGRYESHPCTVDRWLFSFLRCQPVKVSKIASHVREWFYRFYKKWIVRLLLQNTVVVFD